MADLETLRTKDTSSRVNETYRGCRTRPKRGSSGSLSSTVEPVRVRFSGLTWYEDVRLQIVRPVRRSPGLTDFLPLQFYSVGFTVDSHRIFSFP